MAQLHRKYTRTSADGRESARSAATSWNEIKRSSFDQGEIRDYIGPED
jgi:hypothetical protein